MIRIIYRILPALGVLALLVGCKKSKLTKYEQQGMVYIYGIGPKDSTQYSFATKPATVAQDTVKIPLRIMGQATNGNRTVNVVVIADSSTAVAGQHYQLLPTIVKAGEYTANIPVLVKKSADLNAREVKLVVEIKESADFKPGAGTVQHKVKLTNILIKPANWLYLQGYFGVYSNVKYLFIINATGRADFPYGPGGTMGAAEMNNFNIMCKMELANYEAANGPLMDENNLRVTFP